MMKNVACIYTPQTFPKGEMVILSHMHKINNKMNKISDSYSTEQGGAGGTLRSLLHPIDSSGLCWEIIISVSFNVRIKTCTFCIC